MTFFGGLVSGSCTTCVYSPEMENINELPNELLAHIFSSFTSFEAHHVLSRVCKHWRAVCKLTNFASIFFVNAHKRIICLDPFGNILYKIPVSDSDDTWLTGICMGPGYHLLSADYRINGLHRLSFNVKSWEIEYHSKFWESPTASLSPEYLIYNFDNDKLFIAADSKISLLRLSYTNSKIKKNKLVSNYPTWGMTIADEKNDLAVFLCNKKKIIKIDNILGDPSDVQVETFSEFPESTRRLGCIKRAPRRHKYEGCHFVLDSFIGKLFRLEHDPETHQVELIIAIDDFENLYRAFDICFIDRKIHPFRGVSTDKPPKNISSSISMLLFCSTGIREYSEDLQYIRTIGSSDLTDCNFAHLTSPVWQTNVL